MLTALFFESSMANYHSKSWLYRWLLQQRKHRTSGFTLMEVLISMIIAGIIISGLLFLVVELLQIDRREIALERVQRDMQRAIDYIADDLEEAVYVYNDVRMQEIVDDIQILSDQMGTGVEGSGDAVPLLAFWRTVPLDDDVLPDTCTGNDDEMEICRVARTRRASYSLIVYYQQHRDDTDADYVWKGPSVLRRYELPQYANLATFTETPGYADPITDQATDFENWEPSTTPDAVGGNSVALVDFVEQADPGGTAVDCRNLVFGLNSRLTGENDNTNDVYDYVVTPENATDAAGFFACIRQPNLADGDFRTTQDVYLFLRGDVESENRFLGPASDGSRFPVLQTQVKLRGVINKDG
ncbi:prepilin-type N-terminal cleavage/methylation domain-containing protein [Leptolyngbyaceae cyanobacterium CCMR0082]|uniref:Prepilin-type N-terminal cleavage/methylation domain-containing protein n=3 Tax=Adonisia TaxID=2950183 RepID=A0A6M0SCI7_9CYAN|nr:prepilin-type N-terminal cleavage/methylation domain-containing protein [Adonisia turfae CCMR0081]NEZ66026.1 prepilin-type N-terminal cleavage/methylation domain-containing protein [Adonisia turfae CCMR0082]